MLPGLRGAHSRRSRVRRGRDAEHDGGSACGVHSAEHDASAGRPARRGAHTAAAASGSGRRGESAQAPRVPPRPQPGLCLRVPGGRGAARQAVGLWDSQAHGLQLDHEHERTRGRPQVPHGVQGERGAFWSTRLHAPGARGGGRVRPRRAPLRGAFGSRAVAAVPHGGRRGGLSAPERAAAVLQRRGCGTRGAGRGAGCRAGRAAPRQGLHAARAAEPPVRGHGARGYRALLSGAHGAERSAPLMGRGHGRGGRAFQRVAH
mmetsp:Transcript_8789/g.30001  ORF Transcript_8789/g.30001 Transcript_8789/m.30001 type:complete len:261 (+) Transcript_8789:1329-2111(+)